MKHVKSFFLALLALSAPTGAVGDTAGHGCGGGCLSCLPPPPPKCSSKKKEEVKKK